MEMDERSDELINELRKVLLIKKSDLVRLKEEFDSSKEQLAKLTSEIAEGRAKAAANKVKIAALDADKFACIQIEKLNAELVEKFDGMCNEICAINEEAEKQITELQLEIEAAKDTKGIISAYEETLEMLRCMRFGDSNEMNDVHRDIENARRELQLLSDEVQTFEMNEKTVSEKLNTVAYADIPLAIKHQIYHDLKRRKGELVRKLMHARLSRSRLDSRFICETMSQIYSRSAQMVKINSTKEQMVKINNRGAQNNVFQCASASKLVHRTEAIN